MEQRKEENWNKYRRKGVCEKEGKPLSAVKSEKELRKTKDTERILLEVKEFQYFIKEYKREIRNIHKPKNKSRT